MKVEYDKIIENYYLDLLEILVEIDKKEENQFQ